MSKQVLTIAAIASVLSWPEDHKPGEEGLFLQPEEATAINSAIEAGSKAAEELAAANTKIEELVAEKTILEEKAAAATTLENKVAELTAEVEKLGGEASGKGTKLDEKGDQGEQKTEVSVGLLNPEHPLNRHARAAIAAKRKFS